MITGQTGLIYKGNDGTGRIIKPDEYQPKGNYAAADHNHNGVYATIAQYNELKTSVSNGKSLIASAITDKGVSTASDATFQTMANNIRSINQNTPILLYTNNNVSAGIQNNATITLANVNFNAFLIEFKYTAVQAYGAGSVAIGDPNSSAIIYYTKSELNIGGAAAFASGGVKNQDGLIYTNSYPSYRKNMKLTNNILNCGNGGHEDSYHPHLDSYQCCIPYRIWGINISL